LEPGQIGGAKGALGRDPEAGVTDDAEVALRGDAPPCPGGARQRGGGCAVRRRRSRTWSLTWGWVMKPDDAPLISAAETPERVDLADPAQQLRPVAAGFLEGGRQRVGR